MHSEPSGMYVPTPGSYDKALLFSMIALVLFGTIMIYSSTGVVTPLPEKKTISEFHYLRRHLITIMLGTIAMIAAYRMKTATMERMALPLLIFSGCLLLLVFVPHIGIKAGGAWRWLRLGIMSFQPSELVKLAKVIFLARYLSRPAYRPDTIRDFVKPLAVMSAFQLVFLKQPEFGATMSLFILTIGMLYVAGTRLQYIGSLLLLALPVIVKHGAVPAQKNHVISRSLEGPSAPRRPLPGPQEYTAPTQAVPHVLTAWRPLRGRAAASGFRPYAVAPPPL